MQPTEVTHQETALMPFRLLARFHGPVVTLRSMDLGLSAIEM